LFVKGANSQEIAETVQKPSLDESTVRPDAPKPKLQPGADEDAACPAGAGKPCAFLGGQRYYRDLWKMTQHDRTWGDAMKNPGVITASALLVGTTILDIEGTDHCLALHACAEANPLMPKRVDRPRQYATAMPLNALGIASLVWSKKRGQGNFAFFLAYAVSCAHAFYGLTGLHADTPSAIAPSPATGKVRR